MNNNIIDSLFTFLEWGAKFGDLFGGLGIFWLTLRTIKRDENNRKDSLFWSNIKHKEDVLNRITFDKDNFGLRALKKYGEADINNRLKNIKHYVNFCERIFEDILSSSKQKRLKYILLIESVFHQDELQTLKKVVTNESGKYTYTERILAEIGMN